MKKSFTGFLIALTINVLGVFACAEGPPVILTHTLTGYSKGPTAVTLEYSMHVVNPGETAIGDLSLSLVPRLPFLTTRTTVNVSYLAPKQSTDLTVKLVTPLLLNQEQFSRSPLFWAGECLDAEGKLVEFPVKSGPGGAK
jgi:hypothetical protein